jgi:uncharacterized membrane protein YidH (DUF202 family)
VKDNLNEAGLQFERTILAWQRTGVALVIFLLLFFRISLQSNSICFPLLVLTVFISGTFSLIYFKRNQNLRLLSPTDSVIKSNNILLCLAIQLAIFAVVTTNFLISMFLNC